MAEWITKKPAKMVDKKTTAKWITKKPKSWITKKPKNMEDKETTAKWITKKPKSWITKKKSTEWIKKKEKSVDPSQMRKQRKQQQEQSRRQYQKQNLTKDYSYTGIPGAKATATGVKYNKGGSVTRFGSSGPEGKPHSTKEGRRAEAQRAYMRKHGPQKPRRKTLAVTDKYKEVREKRKFSEAGFKPLRAKHGLGSLVKKGISKILKPKGVFKPKPVPKAVTDRPTGWSPKGEYTKADDKKITSILKKLGDEIKAAPLPPKLKATLKKAQKASPHKKAEGGRIGLKHGKFVRAAVPHADIDKYVDKGTGKEDDRKGNRSRVEGSTMKFKKPKKSRGPSAGRQAAGQNRAGRQARRSTYQGGGRIGLKHGGSVGAAVRGHGAEIK